MIFVLLSALPVTSTQLVNRPKSKLFVCDWRIQPRWSAGQVSMSVLPLTVAVMLVGFVAIPLITLIVPFMASVLVVQIKLPFNGGSVTDEKPLTGWLNSVKVSPAVKLVVPMFVTMSVPPPTIEVATSRSLLGELVGLISITVAPANVTVLFTV